MEHKPWMGAPPSSFGEGRIYRRRGTWALPQRPTYPIVGEVPLPIVVWSAKRIKEPRLSDAMRPATTSAQGGRAACALLLAS